MTTPDAPDNAHGMDPQDSPGQSPAPGPAAPADAAGHPYAGGANGVGGVEDGAGAPDSPVDETAEEAALRDLMREAVRDLRPTPDALDHLRRAVPARRQHRRQALAGSAATVLLVGAAVPALIHAADGGGSTTAAPANVASTHAAQPGEDGHVNTWGTTGDTGRSDHGRDGGGSGRTSPTAGGTDDPSSLASSPDGLPPVSAPACSSDQLGQGSSNATSLDAHGQAYGWFRVANVSTAPCAVPPGPANVSIFAMNYSDLSQITVVKHTAHDPATELPATDDGPLVLAPGEHYEVAFAWIPADGGPGGCPQPSSPPVTTSPTDTPTDTAVPDPDGPGSAANPMGPPPGAPTRQPATVGLRHTPAAGAPVVFGPTLRGACAGTIYTTAPMAAALSDTPPS